MSAIETRKLGKTYKSLGKRAVTSIRGLDLIVREGEIYGFLGRNGAGKTTTIKILCSLIEASEGSAFLFGESVRSRAARRLIGYLPEQPYFYEYLTPKETLHFYGKVRGLSRAEREREWDRLSEMLDLRGIAEQRIKSFSKGMRQRIGFAVASVGDPPLLILDEPMSGLDPVGRRNIRELIVGQRERKKTVFFSSHVLGDVEQICDRAGILVNGRLAREGSIDELTGTHTHEVEIVAAQLDAETLAQLSAAASSHRRLDEREVFVVDGAETANEMVKRIHASGGILIEYNPLRESLEEHFMREQEEATS
jgi:ABC-2 type transport system ATP-binding protein